MDTDVRLYGQLEKWPSKTEMARLMELQNAYAANARVISVVQDLLNRLMEL